MSCKRRTEFQMIMENCEKLTQEKASVLKQCSDMVSDIQELSDRQATELANVRKTNLERISTAQVEWRANRNNRQEEYLSEQYKRISDTTTRAMEPDFSRLSSGHKSELNRLAAETIRKKEDISNSIQEEYNSHYASESASVLSRCRPSSSSSIKTREGRNRDIIQSLQAEKDRELHELSAKLSSELSIIQQQHSSQLADLQSKSSNFIIHKRGQLNADLNNYNHMNDDHFSVLSTQLQEQLSTHITSSMQVLSTQRHELAKRKQDQLLSNRRDQLQVAIRKIEANFLSKSSRLMSSHMNKDEHERDLITLTAKTKEWTDMIQILAQERQSAELKVNDAHKSIQVTNASISKLKKKIDEQKRNVDGEDSKVNDLSKRNDVDSCVNKILTELEETLKMNMDKLCTDRETYKNEVESLEEKQKNELSTLDNGIKNQFEGLDSDMARMFQLRADEEAKLDGFKKILTEFE